jgi:FecR protein
MKNKFLVVFAAALIGTFGAVSMRAQDQAQDQQSQQSAPPPGQPPTGDTQQDNTPPSDHGVARVSYIHGNVSVQRGDSGDWSAAALNQPLAAGDKISTGDGGRAEVQLDFANILRLGEHSQARIATLTRGQMQVQIGEGVTNFSVLRGSEANVEIDTPNVAIHPGRGQDSFRILVSSDQESQVSVREGEADITTPQGSTHVTRGQLITIHGSAQEAQYKTSDAAPLDDFDRWTNDRNRSILAANSWKHTNQYYTGSEDLDTYGTWTEVPDYGQVWVPNQDPNWAPYRDGNWVWEPYWGWTWSSSEAWGWAPYHYGRWFEYNNSWAWWPGPVYGAGLYYPIWSPAYVSFFGWGGGFGFGFGFGNVGWFPIGPCDPFFPWWGGFRGRFGFEGFGGWRNWNRFGGFGPLHGGERFSNFARAERSGNFRGFSGVAAGRFGVGGVRAGAVGEASFRSGKMMTGNVPIAPTRANLSASGRAAAAGTIRGNSQEHFAGRTRQNNTRSFSQESNNVRQAIQRNNSSTNGSARGNDGERGNNGERSNPQSGARTFNGSTSSGNRAQTGTSAGRSNAPADGWNRFNGNGSTQQGRANGATPNNSARANNAAPNSGARSTNDGWQHFTPQPSQNNSRGPQGQGASRPSYNGQGQGYNRPGYGGQSSGRPSLNMSRPVVTPRSSGGNSGGSRSYGGSRSSGGGSRPSGGGGGHPSGGGGGHPHGR